MAEGPWLTIIGIGEDGRDGLPAASLRALDGAEVVMGPRRHLALVGEVPGEARSWPVPFADGIGQLLALRGRRVAVLASGDPFWFGAGTVLAGHLAPEEWRCLPGPSTFALAAARLGWGLETTMCLGLHAAPLTRLRPHLGKGQRVLALLRDGAAVRDLAAYLVDTGFAATRCHVMEALGGPRARVRAERADALAWDDIAHPVCVGLEVAGSAGLPLTPGRADELFAHDGQISRAAVRAVTLAALEPRPGAHLWDIGGGSGAVSVEWLLSHPSTRATAVEARQDRADRIAENATAFGVDRLQVVSGVAPDALAGLDAPDAIFVGGGLSEVLLLALEPHVATGARLVANAVTLESEAIAGDLARAAGRAADAHGLRGGRSGRAEARLEGGLSDRAMERWRVIVAGFGYSSRATVESLRSALDAAEGGRPGAVAALARKAGGPLADLARALGVEVIGVPQETLAAQPTATRSDRSAAHTGAGSAAEAAALAAAGAGARLLGPRAVSPDGQATCALAEGEGA